MGEVIRRDDLAVQLATDGSETPLIEVRFSDEFKARIEDGVMGGESFEEANKRVGEEMAEERLREAFGEQVVRVSPDSIGNPS